VVWGDEKLSSPGFHPLLGSSRVLGPRALISCCVVAPLCGRRIWVKTAVWRNSRPRGWLRAAQHAVVGAQHLSPQAKKKLRAFFRRGPKQFLKLHFFLNCRKRKNNSSLFLFAVVEKHLFLLAVVFHFF